MTVTYTSAITVVARTVTGQNSDGGDIYTDTTTVVDGVFAPGGSTETTQAGDTVVTQPTVYLPAPAPAAIDQVIVGGVTYEVQGDPADWSIQPNPFTGWVPDLPVVVPLRRVTG